MITRFLLLLLVSVPAFAFDAVRSWPSGTVRLNLALDDGPQTKTKPSATLIDGSTTWNQVAQDAIAIWNAELKRVRLEATPSSAGPGQNNGRNDIAFSDEAYGQPFGERVLAITFSTTDGLRQRIRVVESDILVNRTLTWDSYRGNLRAGIVDLQRVLVHELGHLIGLDHPNQAVPAQQVEAIMNSSISSLDTLAQDDKDGAFALYGTPITRPVIRTQPASGSAVEGGPASMRVELEGGTPASGPTFAYTWLFTPPGGQEEWLFGQPEASIPLGTVQAFDAGRYRVAIETPDGSAFSNSATLTVAPTASSKQVRLYNLSTRGFVGNGPDEALVVGFAVRSSGERRVLIRGVGEGLRNLGVAGAATNVKLELRRTGDSNEFVAANNDWSAGSDANALSTAFAQAGAFPLSSSPSDAAFIVSLPQGNFTATLTPESGSQPGVALVEIYDLGTTFNDNNRLYNLSTRGPVRTGTEIMIGGLAVRGNGVRTYLIRAAGDSLAQFGIQRTLDDPTIRVFDEQGNLLRYSDDWDNPAFLQPQLRSTFSSAGAFEFSDRQETALRLKLRPGNYTLQVNGLDGGTGTALLEIYELD